MNESDAPMYLDTDQYAILSEDVKQKVQSNSGANFGQN